MALYSGDSMPTWSLNNPLLSLVLVVLGGAAMVRTAPRFGSHRGRAASLTLLGLALASFANAYFSYLPRLGDVVGPRPWPVASYQSVSGLGVAAPRSVKPAKGAVVTVVVPGRRSGISPRAAMVYLPPQYFSQPTAHFPVLYLLHGSPGLPVDWFRGGEAATAGLAAATAGTPVILVAPKMSSGWLSDSECIDRRSDRWETYLTDDVVPAVDARFRTQAAATGRGLAGNSAGGYCALAVGLRHPTLFRSIAALSPLTEPTYSYGSLSQLFEHPADLPAALASHRPLWLLQHKAGALREHIRLDVGNADSVAPSVRAFAAADRALGGRPLLVVRDGGHTFRVWRPALLEAVLWFGRDQRGTTS